MYTIAFVTYSKNPNLTNSDARVAAALAERGIQVVPVAWDAAGVDWTAYQGAVVRSCWNYHLYAAAFRTWLERVTAAGVPVWNTPAVLRWNMDKHYLRDMTEWGVPIVPTVWLARGSKVHLRGLLGRQGWPSAVIKPCISASATGTWVTSLAAATKHQQRLAEMLAGGDVMVQPLLPQIKSGEWSLVFFRSAYSHAVLKTPGSGSIFVQEEHGGSTVSMQPPPHLVAQATTLLETVHAHIPDAPLLYVRVDGVEIDGRLVLMELEAIEPELFLDDAAAGRFAAAIHEIINTS